MAADRALKKALKRTLRDPVAAVARTLERVSPEDPCTEVLATYTELIRTTLMESSKPPFVFGSLRTFETLGRLEASLQRNQTTRGHSLLTQLLAVVRRRRAFTAAYRRLHRQRSWLVELERRLDPPVVAGGPRPSGAQVQLRAKAFLAELQHHAGYHPHDAAVVAHISTTFAHRWPLLFACYAWSERYRTNNASETFFGKLRNTAAANHQP